jgi:putative membrane protein
MTIMMMFAIGTGIWLWVVYFPSATGWMHAKIAFVVLMLVYHLWTKRRMKEMQEGHLNHSGVYYRWANEIPLLLVFVILVLVVLKPF